MGTNEEIAISMMADFAEDYKATLRYKERRKLALPYVKKDSDLKLFVLVRTDILSRVQRAVQACHAVASLMAAHRHHPQLHQWATKDKTLILLGGNQNVMDRFLKAAKKAKILVADFKEPDIGDVVTAVAAGPITRKKAIKVFGADFDML